MNWTDERPPLETGSQGTVVALDGRSSLGHRDRPAGDQSRIAKNSRLPRGVKQTRPRSRPVMSHLNASDQATGTPHE